MTDHSTAGNDNTTLVRLARARAELAEAKTLDDVLHIRDIARASEVLLRAAREAGDAANDAAEVRILAEHKAGGMLREMKENKQRVSSGGDYTQWYTKQGRWGKQQVYDVINCSDGSAPNFLDHDWEQSADGIERLVTELTQPGELVVDPFAGTCTWGRVVAECGRRWIGSDVVEGGTTIAS